MLIFLKIQAENSGFPGNFLANEVNDTYYKNLPLQK